MNNLSPDILPLAQRLRQRLASGLPPSIAKLYSQYTRVREGQLGLPSWTSAEAQARLDEAVQLIDAAFIERSVRSDDWQSSARRAAEILEWLAQPDVLNTDAPVRLLAAAVYQLAGYPARAAGLLRDVPIKRESLLIHALLRADFDSLLAQLINYWSETLVASEDVDDRQVVVLPQSDFQDTITHETASVLGILCAAMRWGDEERIERAMDKFGAIARLMLHGRDPYSWLLARLSVEVVNAYLMSSLRRQCAPLVANVGQLGRSAFERYFRQSYASGKTLTWPSQMLGIARLAEHSSFVLCTPTGSGKTTVAELAILRSLFAPEQGGDAEVFGPFDRAPLVLYLTPSRALAAEVESKLSRVLRSFDASPKITVTGLYGGIDWGPTDVWMTANERVVVIATYEKAEALFRFLGAYFLSRISLVIIDEAHGVQFDPRATPTNFAENRALRLESLGARLFARLNPSASRVIALSAVASGIEDALAGWITGRAESNAESIAYRSTRQIIGRLECLQNRGYEIQYDILDGAPLQFVESELRDAPYIPNPFPPHPAATQWLSAKQMERRLIPYILWAAIHFATPNANGKHRSVLVSITQDPQVYAEAFLTLLDEVWVNISIPRFFTPPTQPQHSRLWEICLRSCADYFGDDSHEYRLLSRGIVFHHGKMPGSLARLLVEVIEGCA